MTEFLPGQRVRHIGDGSIGTVVAVRPDPSGTDVKLTVRVRWDRYSPTWNLARLLEATDAVSAKASDGV